MPTVLLDRYCERIGYSGRLVPTPATLRALCQAHVRTVPFELLDGPAGIRPDISPASVFEKVVIRRCGGACMELNGLFAHVLRRIGFEVTILASHPWLPHLRSFTGDADHMVLVVSLDGAEWLVDVGYSQLTATEPMRIDGTVHRERGWSFRVSARGADLVVERRGRGARWTPIHWFDREPPPPDHFPTIVDRYLNPVNDSPILHTVMCSRVTSGGRLVLVNDRLMITEFGRERSVDVPDDAACRTALESIFAGHPHLVTRGLSLWRRVCGAGEAKRNYRVEEERT